MDNGTLKTIGAPENVFRKPNSVFVADFVGTKNIYENAQVKHKEGNSFNEEPIDGEVIFCVRPENTSLHVTITFRFHFKK